MYSRVVSDHLLVVKGVASKVSLKVKPVGVS